MLVCQPDSQEARRWGECFVGWWIVRLVIDSCWHSGICLSLSLELQYTERIFTIIDQLSPSTNPGYDKFIVRQNTIIINNSLSSSNSRLEDSNLNISVCYFYSQLFLSSGRMLIVVHDDPLIWPGEMFVGWAEQVLMITVNRICYVRITACSLLVGCCREISRLSSSPPLRAIGEHVSRGPRTPRF